MHVNRFVGSIHREFENNGVAYLDLFFSKCYRYLVFKRK